MTTRTDAFTQTSTNPYLYSDFMSDFDPHPITGDLIRARNESAIKLSLQNLLRTNYGERLFNSNIGSNIYNSLFEPNDSIIEADLKASILETINNNEPRVSILDISVESGNQKSLISGALVPFGQENSIAVTITFMLINSLQPQTVTITLNRVR